MANDYDISQAFQTVEEELIESMIRNMKRHTTTEQAEGLNYSQWQAEQLAALAEYRKRNAKEFGNYFSTINTQIDDALKQCYKNGNMDQEIAILEAMKKGFTPPKVGTIGTTYGDFFKINDRRMNALLKATRRDMQKAETAMLRMANDQYRKIIFNAGVYYDTGAGTLEKSVDMATKDFLSAGLNCIEYANGRRVSIDSYASMALRTNATRSYLAGEASMRDDWGMNTVIVNKRGVACPRCLQWVGRVYYDDVWGTVPVTDDKYPRLSTAIQGGLYHPNCKDSHTTYFEGINSEPTPMTKAQEQEATRVYDLEQQQRYNERMIRKYKRLRDGSLDADNQAKYSQKADEWEQKNAEFIEENGDVLKRRYENEKTRGITGFTAPPPAPKIPKPPKIVAPVKVEPPKVVKPAPVAKVKEPTFVPAKTIEEAKKFATDNLADSVDFSGMSLDRCNEVNEALFKMREQFPKCKKYKEIVTTRRGKAYAKSNAATLTINSKSAPSPKDAKVFDDIKNANEAQIKLIREQLDTGLMYGHPMSNDIRIRQEKLLNRLLDSNKFSRWSTVTDTKSMIYHEYGHSIADQMIGQINGNHFCPDYGKYTEAGKKIAQINKLVDNVFKQAKNNGDIYNISEYGNTDVYEFFAEVFSMNQQGEPLPEYISEMIKEVTANAKL